MNARYCKPCHAHVEKLRCAVCNAMQPKSMFSASQLHHQAERPVRCQRCLTCVRCGDAKPAKAFVGSSDTCHKCTSLAELTKKRSRCPACDEESEGTQAKVCRRCTSLGCTQRDPSFYRCVHGCVYGRNQFPDKILRYRDQGRTRICSQCLVRDTRIRRTLARKDAWRCTCHKPIHTDSCTLAPRREGERRWPGKNLKVSEDDLAFIAMRGSGRKKR